MKSQYKTKIIELFGLPRTGKTTTVIALKKHLTASGHKVGIIKERASICPLNDKLHPTFNFWTSISLFKEYLEANDKGFDFILADRGIFDAFVWINFLSKPETKSDFIKLVSQDFILSNYLTTFFLTAENEVILDREFERQIGRKYGKIMNPDTLSAYKSSYQELKSQLMKWGDICEIDSTKLSIKETISIVSKELTKKITTANNVYKK